ncbi:MAG TPA: tRNA (N6-threonylcarbamoyladenosine(37)-N6)-methyltransferase TrmO [Methanofastidiosum sp.]|nr:tRNA (N6-threonylcarbamoyladenosine(37)-N6)-methyltransferase TrmO [Methanofastidiosum sp.]HNU62093.1 tRNA (N6-threonylcarbamoyladenosine(37)-N6)-methyltransferase TrmO [Methanofastidiosum sp.]HOI76095.1 tRNA (N6-threonylcarbamoyladenosine(37)-N6)-methyltransferase TrmO [Methanofastidiosum sp.]
MKKICYSPIGIVHSEFKEKINVPIQSVFSNKKGIIEIYPEFSGGLKDLDGFSHIFLIYHFHLSKGFTLKVKPFLDDVERGIFSTRAPKRPNNIGLSILSIERIENNMVYVSDIDIIDNTPVLDIKPYVPDFDQRQNVKDGWFSNKIDRKEYLSDNRFSF